MISTQCMWPPIKQNARIIFIAFHSDKPPTTTKHEPTTLSLILILIKNALAIVVAARVAHSNSTMLQHRRLKQLGYQLEWSTNCECVNVSRFRTTDNRHSPELLYIFSVAFFFFHFLFFSRIFNHLIAIIDRFFLLRMPAKKKYNDQNQQITEPCETKAGILYK